MKKSCLVVALLALSHVAHAESKSWNAVKGKLPSKTIAVVTATADKSMFVQLLEIASQEPELVKLNTRISTACKLNLTDVVHDATAIVVPDKQPSGFFDTTAVLVLGLQNLDRKGAQACIKLALADVEAGNKVTELIDGKSTAYNLGDPKASIWITWLADDVVAFAPDHFSDKKMLLAALKGGKPIGELGKSIKSLGATTDTAMAWFVYAKREQIAKGQEMRSAFGTAIVNDGSIALNVSVATNAAATATALVNEGQQEKAKLLEKAAKAKGSTVEAFIRAITMTATGSNMTATGSFEVKSMAKMFKDLEQMF
jgi:hypothetical protein